MIVKNSKGILLFLVFLSNVYAFGQENNGTITDIDGNIYKTVKIGDQWWMAENLKTTRYCNGDLIGTTTTATLDIFVLDAPKYQWAYAGNESNVAAYGRLYTWHAVTDSRNICPKSLQNEGKGWHIPSDAEWTTLATFLGEGATKNVGFTALPGGYRYYSGHFFSIGSHGYWWSSTEQYTDSAWARYIYFELGNVSRDYFYKNLGLSVRCVMDRFVKRK